jgi:hypothetical protein
MKPLKGKTMSKAGGCVCICNTNAIDTRLWMVSHPGLRRQDTRLGGQMEQVKSVLSRKTKRRENSVHGEGDKLVADQIVVAWNGL